jgi:hypothetical protein
VSCVVCIFFFFFFRATPVALYWDYFKELNCYRNCKN